MAFARYIAGEPQTPPWNVEAIEIDASLPKMNTQGRLRAIRRVLLGKPQYQVLELEGDKTVRQQVILRYLSAQVQAASVPASSVAITPVNYKFSYKGPIETPGAVAYSFTIKPRKKAGRDCLRASCGLANRRNRLGRPPVGILGKEPLHLRQARHADSGNRHARWTRRGEDYAFVSRHPG